MKFEDWWEKRGSNIVWTDVLKKQLVRVGWDAATLNAREIHELRGKYKDELPPTDEDPIPTLMVKRLLENGWRVMSVNGQDIDGLCPPNEQAVYGLREAYHKAFPRKKRVEVEVWYCPICKCVRACPDICVHDQKKIVHSTATFWVEEEGWPAIFTRIGEHPRWTIANGGTANSAVTHSDTSGPSK